MKSFFIRAALLTATAILPAAAFAQAGWAPGAELVGQPIQVTTKGVTNTLYLDAGGQLRILTPLGRTVPGTWTAANGQLCLFVAAAQECLPYNAPLQAQQPQTFTTSCNSASTWLVAAVNVPPPPPPTPGPERGK